MSNVDLCEEGSVDYGAQTSILGRSALFTESCLLLKEEHGDLEFI